MPFLTSMGVGLLGARNAAVAFVAGASGAVGRTRMHIFEKVVQKFLLVLEIHSFLLRLAFSMSIIAIVVAVLSKVIWRHLTMTHVGASS